MNTMSGGWDQERSPFHAAELDVQERVGVKEKMDRFARRVVRTYMPDQHREFYGKLPFIPVGYVDQDGWPWATALTGKPGFMTSPDQRTLSFTNMAGDKDPILEVIKPGTPLGLCGIEFKTRRRNRVNVRVDEVSETGFSTKVDQSFGNCPQYIQTRDMDFEKDPTDRAQIRVDDVTLDGDSLPDDVQALIAASDTFFVSSYVEAKDDPTVEGVDVSHRGGRPGFVKMEGRTLLVPDFLGNFHFNTLGNLMTNPKAGLVFFDFETGDLLQVTGRTEILWDGPVVDHFKGAERIWTLAVERVRWLRGAFPKGWHFGEFSPNSTINGTWEEADAAREADERRHEWLPYRVTKIVEESSVIRSFYFEPVDCKGLMSSKAGQFLTIRVQPDGVEAPVIRTYTLSSAPHDTFYRISVKREDGRDGAPDGLVSCHLHKTLKVGDVIEAKAPAGDFYIDAAEARPAVLMAGGVGITPMISMARHVAREGLRTRHLRPLTIIQATQDTAQRAFFDEFTGLMQSSKGGIRYVSMISNPAEGEVKGEHYNGEGYITADVLRSLLPIGDYDFFLCGPGPFMQVMYDTLRALGVRDARIFAEAFGPASLTRNPDEATEAAKPLADSAEEAVIEFATSAVEQRWDREAGTLLELAEAHGIEAPFACRNGVCGTCKVKLKAGKVTYADRPSAQTADDEALLCCAVPAKGSDRVVVDV